MFANLPFSLAGTCVLLCHTLTWLPYTKMTIFLLTYCPVANVKLAINTQYRVLHSFLQARAKHRQLHPHHRTAPLNPMAPKR